MHGVLGVLDAVCIDVRQNYTQPEVGYNVRVRNRLGGSLSWNTVTVGGKLAHVGDKVTKTI